MTKEEALKIAALGHNMTAHAEVAATCTTAGNSAYWSCSRCGKYFSDAEGEFEIAPDSWVIAATGHDYGELIAEAAATCTADGLTEGSHCSVCNEVLVKQEVVKTGGHQWSKGETVKQPTCVDAGELVFVCTVCNEKRSELLPATGLPTFGNWETSMPAAPGVAGPICRTCAIGDADGDGELTSADARLALRASVGLTEKGDLEKDSAGYLACDVDHDGEVTSGDARLILRASVGLEKLS